MKDLNRGSLLEELYELIRSIPIGRVSGYGDLGKSLSRPVSGLLVGRWVANCPSDLPWWRVVGADGRMPVWKRDPNLETIQRDRLIEEGVEFVDEKVDMARFRFAP
ncbi:MAG: MGMT family protein [Fimbriimonadaceae bacterium]|nr:MGMT family protein [Fimbriimonadaceae bacterium]